MRIDQILDERQPGVGSWVHYGLGTLNANLPKFVFLGQYRDTRVKQTSTDRKTVKPNFVVDDQMVADFRALLRSNRVRVNDELFKRDTDFIRAMIRYEIDRALFGVGEAKHHLIEVDPQAKVALTTFGEAARLSDLSKLASKAAH